MTVDDQLKAEAVRYGASQPINPYVALLDEVSRTAGHVAWLGLKVASAECDEDLILPWRHAPWLSLYRSEREHLTAVSSSAVKLGIAERHVQVLEAQAELTAAALTNVLDRLGLPAELRELAPRLLREELLALEAGQAVEPGG